jgi:hypothetical protein
MYAGHGMVIVASGRGRPIAAVPLDSVPWDGYARIWADGSLEPPHPLRPVVRPLTPITRSDQQADVVAASRALLPLPAGAVSGKVMRALLSAPQDAAQAGAPSPDPRGRRRSPDQADPCPCLGRASVSLERFRAPA